jgi:DNA-binding MarR family transcriptional regulator
MSPDTAVLSTLLNWIDILMRHSMPDLLVFAKEHDLSMSQIGALFHIHRNEASGVSGLGDDLGVTCAAASQMLERLVQLELVTRTEDPHDRRLRQLGLTSKGHQVLQASLRARQRWLIALVSTLTPTEKSLVTDTLSTLIAHANQLEQRPEVGR